jgi:hypothetical protein
LVLPCFSPGLLPWLASFSLSWTSPGLPSAQMGPQCPQLSMGPKAPRRTHRAQILNGPNSLVQGHPKCTTCGPLTDALKWASTCAPISAPKSAPKSALLAVNFF